MPDVLAASNPEARCRRAVGVGGRGLGIVTAKQKVLCHLLRMREKLPAVIDCNDTATWTANGFKRGLRAIQRAEKRLHNQVARHCGDVAGPSALQYNSCPAPCGSVSIAAYSDVADCVQCLTESGMTDLIDQAYGTPPLPLPAQVVQECQAEVGRSVRRYFAARSRWQQLCQYRKDVGAPRFYGVTCQNLDDPSHPYQPRMDLLRARLGLRVQQACEFVNIPTELDTCGTDVPSEISCLEDHVQQCTQDLFDFMYPSL